MDSVRHVSIVPDGRSRSERTPDSREGFSTRAPVASVTPGGLAPGGLRLGRPCGLPGADHLHNDSSRLSPVSTEPSLDPGVQIVVGTAKARLAVLKSLDKTPAGQALIDAWHQLTGFRHHHAYQLSSAVPEVRAQCAAAERSCLGGMPESSSGSAAGDTVMA